MGDYEALGQAFRWGPDQIDKIPWMMRKDMIADYKEAMREAQTNAKS